MSDRDFDKIREKLYDMEVPVEAALWQDIQDTMRRRKLRRAFYYAISSAAAIVVAFMLLMEPHNIAAPGIVPAAVLPDVMAENIQNVATPDIAAIAEKFTEDTPANTPVYAQANITATAQENIIEETAENPMGSSVENTAGENSEEDYVAGAETHESAWDISWDFPEKKRKEFVLGFNGGIMPGSSAGFSGPSIMASSSHNGSGQHSYIIEQVSDTKYSLPLNLGVQMQFQVGENLALGVGLNYTMLKSKFDCLVNKVRYSGKQTLHYIGLPVNVYGIIADRNNFTFYLNGGAMIEKGLKANYEFHSYMDSHSFSEDIDGVQLSFNAGMGVEYKLTKYAGLYFEPNIVYFINPDMQYCIRTDQPLQIKGELGCRFHF